MTTRTHTHGAGAEGTGEMVEGDIVDGTVESAATISSQRQDGSGARGEGRLNGSWLGT
jgi:hypothetical protein